MNILGVIRFVRFPIRLVAMVPILMSLLWGNVSETGLFYVVAAGLLAVLVGEWLGRSKLRTSAIVFVAVLAVALAVSVLSFMLGSVGLSERFGPHKILSAHGIVQSSAWVFIVCAALRALAQRNTLFFAIEFWAMALACAHAFLPHRNRAVLQPLWLSDRAWQEGMDPTAMLSAVGAGLAVVLVVLTLLEKTKPGEDATDRGRSFVAMLTLLTLIPIVVVFLLLLIDPPSLNDEDPPDSLSQIIKEFPKGQGDPEIVGGGSGNAQNDEERAYETPRTGEAKPPLPVAVVLFESDHYPPSQYYYLRQDAFSAFNGLRLGPSADPSIPLDGIRGFPTKKMSVNQDAPMMNRDRIIGKVALMSPHNSPFGIERLLSYEPTLNTRPGTFARTYAFESAATNITYNEMVNFPVGNPEWSPELWAHYLEVPSDERYLELAESIVAELKPEWRENPFAQALMIKLHLDNKTKYTKRVRHAQAADPTASFLFGPTNQYIGYCVHTAHAAALLWRSLGLPARIGVGYAVDAENRRSDGLLVRDIDAHAWPEIYMQNIGWVPLDIAPNQNLDQSATPPDPSLSDSLIELARQQDDMRVVQSLNWADIWSIWRPFLLKWLGGLLFYIFIVHYAFKFGRRYRPLFQATPHSLYVSGADALAEIGVFRLKGESRDSFSDRIGHQFPEWHRLNQHCQSVRYGQKNPDIALVVESHRALLSTIQQQAPFIHRFLGLLNPFSFYRTR